MKVKRVLLAGKMEFEFDAETPKAVFSKLAMIDDLFAEKCCGCCKSENIRFTERKVDNGSYLEMRCLDCNAQLDYGQNKEGGGIFVKKWDKENRRPMPNGGWHVYQRQGDSYEPPANAAPSQQRRMDPPPPTDGDIPF